MADSDDFDRSVFINCPFDTEYHPLFEAIVFTVSIAGFRPRCALEASNAGANRLTKTLDIIDGCRYGIHDLSRTQPGAYGLPRFNMPFELGLDIGCKRYGSDVHRKAKSLLILDRSRFRYQKFLSDIAGQDIRHHSSNPRRATGCVRDWLSLESRNFKIPGGDHIFARYREFRKGASPLCVGRNQRLRPSG
ncbi:MAG: hypothetical protein ABJC13_25425 [Acidobacteriota bacterium]